MTIYPTKVSTGEAIEIIEHYSTNKVMINTAADWGPSNPLNVVKTALEIRKKGYAENIIQELVWNNPVRFYEQSGKLKLDS
ncbi:hypothetical protein [Brevibacillus laterosporus]|nr:hypothetical protein [Brevibacillus laterosporus]ERM18270.1 hypothetical protein P615_18150 [Brevibacillus laterosporus PE36]